MGITYGDVGIEDDDQGAYFDRENSPHTILHCSTYAIYQLTVLVSGENAYGLPTQRSTVSKITLFPGFDAAGK